LTKLLFPYIINLFEYLHSVVYDLYNLMFFLSEAQAEIAGASEKYLMLNSPLHLECVVQQSPVDPVYIFWYHDSRMINYDSDRGVNVTSDLPNKHSALYIERASRAHSGNYTCAPSNAFPANTVIHILNGKYDYNRLHQGTIEARALYLTTNIHHTNCGNFLRFGWIIYSVIGFFLFEWIKFEKRLLQLLAFFLTL